MSLTMLENSIGSINTAVQTGATSGGIDLGDWIKLPPVTTAVDIGAKTMKFIIIGIGVIALLIIKPRWLFR